MRAYPAASSEQSGGYKLRLEYIGRSRENLASKRMMNLFNNCHVFTRGLGEASQIKVGILGGNDRRWRRNGGDEIVTSLRFSCLMFPFEYVRSDRNNVFLLVSTIFPSSK